MKTSKLIFLLFIFSVTVNFASSIEISLEENKAESGTIGYVDLDKVFKRFSMTKKAKEKLKKSLEEKQKLVDERKKELNYYISLREKLKTEYSLAKMYEEYSLNIKSQIEKSSYTLFSSSVTLSSDTVNVSTDSSVNISIPAADVLSSTENISANISTDSLKQATTSQYTEGDNNLEPPYIVMPGVGKIPITSFKFTVSSSPAVIEVEIEKVDERINKLKDEIISLKEKYDRSMADEVNLETDRILVKIYNAIQELSREEKVSVVVDKKSILYGHKAVDLTDKLIKKLEENEF